MAHFVRSADVRKERPALTAFLREYLSRDADDARFEWLYHRNPAGHALAWVACDSQTLEIIGISAAFPREVWCCGKKSPGYVLGDFCIHPDHRSLGPALALQKATLESLSQQGAFVWDFPSTSMVAIYKRLRIETTTTMTRYAKPLRADRQLRSRIPSKLAAGAVAAVANVALRMRDEVRNLPDSWAIVEQTEYCDDEFTRTAESWSSRYEICPARSAEYLNWRFLGHPQRRHHLLSARKGAKLGGYLVYHLSGDDGVIAELFAEDASATKALLVEAIHAAREGGAQTLSAPLCSTLDMRTVFEECGFRPRESSPVILLKLPWNANAAQSCDPRQCYLTQGDRES